MAIQKGEIVLPLLASANHDEDIFPNAGCFNIKRNVQGHVALGTGIHYCFGSQLARMQASIAFDEIFKAFKSFERGDHELTYLDSFFFRSLKELHMRLVSNNA